MLDARDPESRDLLVLAVPHADGDAGDGIGLHQAADDVGGDHCRRESTAARCRRSPRARGGSARASRAPRPTTSGGAFATKRSFASIASARATSLRRRSISASRLPSTFARLGRTTAAKIRRSSSEPSSTWTPLRRKICAASCTRSSAPASSANRASGSGHGETISRASRSGQLRPDLLGDVRHHRVQEREQALERGEGRRRSPSASRS